MGQAGKARDWGWDSRCLMKSNESGVLRDSDFNSYESGAQRETRRSEESLVIPQVNASVGLQTPGTEHTIHTLLQLQRTGQHWPYKGTMTGPMLAEERCQAGAEDAIAASFAGYRSLWEVVLKRRLITTSGRVFIGQWGLVLWGSICRSVFAHIGRFERRPAVRFE